MKTKKIILPAFILIIAGIYSCQKDVSRNTGANFPKSVTVFLTDHQTPVFDSVFIDIQKIEIKTEIDSTGAESWTTLSIHPGVYNILRFRNGLDTLMASTGLPGGDIRKIRITLGTQNAVMKNGVSSPLKLKDNDREVVINIGELDFDLSSQGQAQFWIDFDAAGSIRVDNSGPGNNNGFELRPHINIFGKNHSGGIEGKVFPAAAQPIVMTINGTDTTTAIPEREGEYKIMGLDEGTYKVILAGSNGYLDTTLNNVTVRKGEDTHLPSITLHQ